MKNDNIQNAAEKQHKRGFFSFIFRHKTATFLFLLALGIFLWAVTKMYMMERHFSSEKEQLAQAYDSLAIRGMELTAKTFSWAIRGELIRENQEQVNEFFLNFIKTPNMRKVQLIDAPSAKVLISTNKKEEGTNVSEPAILEAESTIHQTNDSIIKIITPVMGLDRKIAILVIEMGKKR
jgi:hypothetical protein